MVEGGLIVYLHRGIDGVQMGPKRGSQPEGC